MCQTKVKWKWESFVMGLGSKNLLANAGGRSVLGYTVKAKSFHTISTTSKLNRGRAFAMQEINPQTGGLEQKRELLHVPQTESCRLIDLLCVFASCTQRSPTRMVAVESITRRNCFTESTSYKKRTAPSSTGFANKVRQEEGAVPGTNQVVQVEVVITNWWCKSVSHSIVQDRTKVFI